MYEHRYVYTRADWNMNRMQYIDDARQIARDNRPAKVYLLVKESAREKPVLMVTIICRH